MREARPPYALTVSSPDSPRPPKVLASSSSAAFACPTINETIICLPASASFPSTRSANTHLAFLRPWLAREVRFQGLTFTIRARIPQRSRATGSDPSPCPICLCEQAFAGLPVYHLHDKQPSTVSATQGVRADQSVTESPGDPGFDKGRGGDDSPSYDRHSARA